MIFEIDDDKITASATAKKLTPSKRPSLIARRISIHPPSLSPPLSSASSSASFNRRRPLLQRHGRSASSSFAELAGGTAAECAAVCCCCPCGLANLLYLTVYKVPAGLCRRALRRNRRKKLLKKGLLSPRTKGCHCGFDGTELHVYPATSKEEFWLQTNSDEEFSSSEDGEDEEMTKLEEEMWKTFYSTGFWRSPSQREQSPKCQ